MRATSFVTSHTSSAFTLYMRCIILFSASKRQSAWDIRSGNCALRTMEQGALPNHVKCEYNQRDPFCSYFLATRLICRRRGSIRAECMHLNQATRPFQLSRVSRACFALDQTTNGLSCARNTHRSDQRQTRTACRKRPVTASTDHLTSTNQTARLPAERPASPGASGQNGSDLETDPLSCPAGYASARARVSSSGCSGNANHRRTRESRGFRPRRSA